MKRKSTTWLAFIALVLQASVMTVAAPGEQKEKKKRDRYSAVVS